MGTILDPSDPRAPKYWRYETGGELAPAIEAYLNYWIFFPKGKRLTIRQIALIRAYLLQWVSSPVWVCWGGDNSGLDALRQRVSEIKTVDDVRAAIHAGLEIGIDPL